jgi:hypothetical protein
VVRREHLIAVVGAFLIGCVVLLIVAGCAGVRSEAPQEDEQGRSDRCEGTRTFKKTWWRADRFPENLGVYTTNDVPGCPKGGLLTGTDKKDRLDGKEGDDEIHGLGGVDNLFGGRGNDIIYDAPGDAIWLLGDDGDDVLYGGDGNEELYGGGGEDVLYGGDGNEWLFGEEGEDVVHGGDGNDWLEGSGDGRQRDKLYCGEGEDHYTADKLDYVDSSCEVKGPPSNL